MDQDSKNGRLSAFAYAAAFGAALGLWLDAGLLVARSGLGSPKLLAGECAAVLVAAAFALFVLPARARDALAERSFVPPLLTLAVLLSPILALVVGGGLRFLYPPLALAGLLRALPFLRRVRFGALAFLVLGPALLAAYLFVEIHASHYAHVYTPEFTRIGRVSLDTLFHTSMSHMIQNFGTGSTGVDGLVPIHYHHGSHAWFAGMGRIAGTPPLLSYTFGQTAVAVPALLLALFLASVALGGRASSAPARVAVAIALVWVFDRIGWTSYYISESYTFGLSTLLLGLPLLIDLMREPGRSPRAGMARTAGMLAVVFVAACMKVSVGVVLGVSFGWMTLRLRGVSRHTALTGLALVGIAAFLWFRLKPTTGLPLTETFSFLHFYRIPNVALSRYGGWTSPLLPLLYLGYLSMRLRNHALSAELHGATRRMAELVLVATLIALAPGIGLALWPGTAWWFANVAHWLVLPMAVAFVEPARWHAHRRWLAAAVLGVVLVVATGHTFRAQRWKAFEAKALYLLSAADALGRRHYRPPVTDIWSYFKESVAKTGRAFRPEVREGLARSRGALIEKAVLEGLASGSRNGYAVFVPPEARAVLPGMIFPCFTRSLLIPSLTGVPMIEGITPGCRLVDYMVGYGFGDYGEESIAKPFNAANLCTHAVARGFTRLLILRQLYAQNQILECER